ncbi:MAG: sodium:proton antiporter [Neisseria sp.]|nr:sodium:proton antiporter [Neisseria sp.]
MKVKSVFASLLFAPFPAAAALPDGASLSLLWGLPFACILLSIATGPLLLSNSWHHHFGKITAFWTLLFLLPFMAVYGWDAGLGIVVHAVVDEYIPFILLLLALYTVSGGILVWGSLRASPKLNTLMLAAGTLLASVMGTTGAAMLMIRPLLRANGHRKYRVHVVVFFIFLVANIGGGLTPLGDPPLFLGFLKGVGFSWTVSNMLLPVLSAVLILLAVFYALDSHYFRKEGPQETPPAENHAEGRLKIHGKRNLLLLAAVVGSVLLSGVWQPGTGVDILGSRYALQNLVRDILLLVITLLSVKFTPKQVRAGNEFGWGPIEEVGKLFLGIFITIVPVLMILKAGSQGGLAFVVSAVHNAAGEPVNAMYFWMTGLLSAFLDNAPTYLVFFNLAGGNAQTLMDGLPHTLLAVSTGSVFMGALTYIGNAPNFMVKAIAEQRKVKMPGFFGYMAWSFGILVPLFLVQTLVFFVWELV